MFINLRSQILCCLDHYISKDFEQLLADVIKTNLDDPYLNRESIRLTEKLYPLVKKEIQELVAARLVICNNNKFRKLK